jgi:hypothetical protein
MRVYIWVQTTFFEGSFALPGMVLVVPPVIASFGVVQVITGRTTGWWRIPLVIALALVGIALTFYMLIPKGYDLVR